MQEISHPATVLAATAPAPAAVQLSDAPILLELMEPNEATAPQPAFVLRVIHGIASAIGWVFGALWMIVMLAVLATIPVLNLLSLGYLLMVSGRVAQTGRLRDGFIGIRKAAVIGRIVVPSMLFILPIQFLARLRDSAYLIDPQSRAARGWQFTIVILTTLIVLHIIWAVIRGGRLRHFLWPAPIRFVRWLFTPGKYVALRDAVWDFTVSLKLPAYFSLGLRGFLGAMIWLILPVGMMVIATRLPPKPGAILSLLGALDMGVVVLYLPFLQVHFAAENRFAAMFELRRVRQLFTGAPIAFWVALLAVLLFSLPLYLLKIELTPRELAWLPSLVFVVFMFPARLLSGWAVGRARRRDKPPHFIFRWLARFAVLPVVFFYVLFVYLTQYLSWYGAMSLLEQHAFLVPSPMGGF